MKENPIQKHNCAICAAALKQNVTHVLCDRCRIDCGGYDREFSSRWSDLVVQPEKQ